MRKKSDSPELVREFLLLNFVTSEGDGKSYTTSDIVDFAQSRGDLVQKTWTTLRVGDVLRRWAEGNKIHQGFVCDRIREIGKRDRFAIYAYNSSSLRPMIDKEIASEPRSPEKVAAPAFDHAAGSSVKKNVAQSSRFSGKIMETRGDGIMLVSYSGKLYKVEPLNW